MCIRDRAYFLQELIDQNEALSEADMETFAAMTLSLIHIFLSMRSRRYA